MRNKFTLILAVFIVVLFGLYAITFQVDYNEVAVKTRFGAATENSVYRGDRDSGILGNLHFRWFWPVEQVRTYDRRVRVWEAQIEELQTLDNHAVAVSSYVTWQITDPLTFFRTMQDPRTAEQQIRGRMRGAHSVIGRYTFDQLTNAEGGVELAQLEQEILDRLRGELSDEGGRGYGFEITSVGLKRIVLPEQVTARVFERMGVTRERLAEHALSEGDAEAENIRARAESASKTILAFARRRADAIEADGHYAAAQYYDVFQENEEFAVFLRTLEANREVFRRNTTFMFDAKQGGLGGEFYGGPQVPMAQTASGDSSEGVTETSADTQDEEASTDSRADSTVLDLTR